jgi:hypothetical protein
MPLIQLITLRASILFTLQEGLEADTFCSAAMRCGNCYVTRSHSSMRCSSSFVFVERSGLRVDTARPVLFVKSSSEECLCQWFTLHDALFYRVCLSRIIGEAVRNVCIPQYRPLLPEPEVFQSASAQACSWTPFLENPSECYPLTSLDYFHQNIAPFELRKVSWMTGGRFSA